MCKSAKLNLETGALISYFLGSRQVLESTKSWVWQVGKNSIYPFNKLKLYFSYWIYFLIQPDGGFIYIN